MFERPNGAPGAASRTQAQASLLSSDTVARAAALPLHCHPNALTGLQPGSGACRTASAGGSAYAKVVAAEEQLAALAMAFEHGAVAAMECSEKPALPMSPDQIFRELTGECEGAGSDNSERKFSIFSAYPAQQPARRHSGRLIESRPALASFAASQFPPLSLACTKALGVDRASRSSRGPTARRARWSIHLR